MAPHSSTFAQKIPWAEEPGRLQSMGSLESDMTERLHFHFSLSCIGEGNGNPLQCSCLEDPRDGGAWWAAVYGVAQSRTRLKRLGGSSSSAVYFQTQYDHLCLLIEKFDLFIFIVMTNIFLFDFVIVSYVVSYILSQSLVILFTFSTFFLPLFQKLHICSYFYFVDSIFKT